MVAIRNYPKNQRAGYPSLPGKNQGHTGDEHQHGRRQKLGNPVHDYEVNGFEIKTLHFTPPPPRLFQAFIVKICKIGVWS
jgi:hypothetical protein